MTTCRNTRTRRAVPIVVAATLLAAACGSSQDSTASMGDSDSRVDFAPLDPGTGEAGGGGVSSDVDDDGGDADTFARPEAAGSAPGAATSDRRADSSAGGDVAPQRQVGLRAGSVDDNAEWEAYLRYRDDFARLGIAVDTLPVSGRRILTVVDADGVPVHDAVLTVDDDRLRTGSDGRAVFLGAGPNRQQQGSTDPVQVTVTHGGASQTAELGTEAHQTIVLDTQRGSGVRLDLAFLIDATGSMDDEIERLKANMVGVAQRIGDLAGQSDVRMALTSYRDEGDDYLARTVEFTRDVDSFVSSLRNVVADGGGDHPEAFNEAFAQVVTRPGWRQDEGVVRLIVLVADAPPHVGRGPSYVDTIGVAAAAGIRVFPIASSGTDDQAEYIFRQVAQATLGRFVFLSYGAGGAAVGESSNIDELDYDVLSLDDLVVRLVEEQLAPLI